MNSRTNCWNNAITKSFFKTLKTKLIYHENYNTINEAELSIFEYIKI